MALATASLEQWLNLVAVQDPVFQVRWILGSDTMASQEAGEADQRKVADPAQQESVRFPGTWNWEGEFHGMTLVSGECSFHHRGVTH